MFSLGALKPLLTTLVLPPGGLLLLLFLACLLARYYRRIAWGLVTFASICMWILACNATAYGLNRLLLTTYAPVNAADLSRAQAIVVLGGGVDQYAPEYGQAILASNSYKRLAYAAQLHKDSHLPILFAGGTGWANQSSQNISEAETAELAMSRDFGVQIQWLDKESRDTRENALRAYELLSPLDKKRILLVTNDWHMQRSLRNFQQAGFEALPAPMGYLQPPDFQLQDFVPSAGGLVVTNLILKEWLGLLLT